MHHGSSSLNKAERYRPQNSISSTLRHHRGGLKKDNNTTTRTKTSPSRQSTLSRHHAENQTSAAPARRRIQLACTRCRKRKIRCSGEVPNGSACTNCQTANYTNCLFLRPEARELLPTPGSALAVHYQPICPLPVTRGSSESDDTRGHQPAATQEAFPFACDVFSSRPQSQSQSLPDLGSYFRLDSLQREDPICETGLLNQVYSCSSYNLHSETPTPMAEYFGTLSRVKDRSWNDVPVTVTASDFEPSQRTVFYASRVPSFCQSSQMASSTEECATTGLLPIPASIGDLSGHHSSITSPYFTAFDESSNEIPFVAEEAYSSGFDTVHSFPAIQFSSILGSGSMAHVVDQNEGSSPDDNNLEIAYTPVTEGALDSFSVFVPGVARSCAED